MQGRRSALKRHLPQQQPQPQQPQQQNVVVQRCRFLPFTDTSSVTAIAINAKETSIAACVSNGNVNIYVRHATAWMLHRKLVGSQRNTVAQCVCWLGGDGDNDDDDYAILTGGGTGLILWDAAKLLRPTHYYDSTGGGVFALSHDRASGRIAVAVEQGGVRLFEYRANQLNFVKVLLGSKARTLSVCMGSGDDSSGGVTAGCADGTICRWDIPTGRVLYLSKLAKTDGKRPAVWAVHSIGGDTSGDGGGGDTVITGDSQGGVQFWEGRSGTLLQTFQEHGADVLCVKANRQGTRVFASGVDSLLVCFAYIGSRWIVHHKTRSHTHDVLALAASASLLVSGGIDTQVLVYNINELREEVQQQPVKLLCVEADAVSSAATASGAGLVLFRSHNDLQVWRMGEYDAASLAVKSPEKLVLQLKATNVHSNVVCSALSPNGVWMAYSDTAGTKIFSVESGGKVGRVAVAATKLLFSQDSSVIILAARGQVMLFRVGDQPQLVHTFKTRQQQQQHKQQDNGDDDDEDDEDDDDNETSASAVTGLCLSHDGVLLAVRHGTSHVSVYNVETLAVAMKKQLFDGVVTAMNFDPLSSVLVVCLLADRFVIFDVERNFQISDFNRDHGAHIITTSKQPPQQGATNSHPVLWIGFLGSSHVVFATPMCLSFVAMAEPSEARRVVKKYQVITHALVDASGSVVLFEKRWTDVLAELPHASLKRSQFGHT